MQSASQLDGVQPRTSSHLSLPFVHLNLCRNPFGQPTLEERAELAVADVDSFVEKLVRPGFAVQFLGECGYGKTTHLLALKSHFPEAHYVHFEINTPVKVPENPLLFLDETQKLPRSVRLDLFRRKSSFVIGTHVDHAAELRALGLEYHTVQLTQLTREKLRAILDRRIEWTRRNEGPVPRLSDSTLEKLMERHGNDIRSMEQDLYEIFQSLKGVGDAEVQAGH
jgi:hypothetical protein